jgi:3-isopropylmalate dehydratase small subunit
MTTGDGTEYPFEIDPSDQQKLLRGIDAIELTLENINLIEAFEHKDKKLRPWVYF